MNALTPERADDPTRRNKRGNPVWILPAVLLFAGCLGYRLGTTLPPHLRSVYVPIVQNRTDEPDLESAVTRELLREFQRDGTLRLELESLADTTVQVTLRHYRLQPMLFDRDDTQQAVEYRLQIQAEVEFIESRTGNLLLKAALEGEAPFTGGMDLNQARRTALEPAARDLAREIVSAVISAW